MGNYIKHAPGGGVHPDALIAAAACHGDDPQIVLRHQGQSAPTVGHAVFAIELLQRFAAPATGGRNAIPCLPLPKANTACYFIIVAIKINCNVR